MEKAILETTATTASTNYWGYRELALHELGLVAGGDDGGDGDWGGDWGGDWAGESNSAAADSGMCPGGVDQENSCSAASAPPSCASDALGNVSCASYVITSQDSFGMGMSNNGNVVGIGFSVDSQGNLIGVTMANGITSTACYPGDRENGG